MDLLEGNEIVTVSFKKVCLAPNPFPYRVGTIFSVHGTDIGGRLIHRTPPLD